MACAVEYTREEREEIEFPRLVRRPLCWHTILAAETPEGTSRSAYAEGEEETQKQREKDHQRA